MPRKKTTAEGQAKPLIACPVCRSKIAPDGAALFEKSAHMEYLENTNELLPKLEEKFKELSAQLGAKDKEIEVKDAELKKCTGEIDRLRLVVREANEREEKKNVGKKETRGNAGSAGASEDEW